MDFYSVFYQKRQIYFFEYTILTKNQDLFDILYRRTYNGKVSKRRAKGKNMTLLKKLLVNLIIIFRKIKGKSVAIFASIFLIITISLGTVYTENDLVQKPKSSKAVLKPEKAKAETQTVEVADEKTSLYSDPSNIVKRDINVAYEKKPVKNSEEKILKMSPESAYNLSDEDYSAMLRIVEAEATSEDIKGKTLVANVVLNRVKDAGFPNSVYGVIHEKIDGKSQFSPLDDGRYYTVNISESTVTAVNSALAGTDYSKGALFFVAKSLTTEKSYSWFDNNLNFLFKYGVHSFYKY